MDSERLNFLKQLLETPSPSGYEERIQQLVRSYVASYADSVETDLHGNLIVARNPKAKLRVCGGRGNSLPAGPGLVFERALPLLGGL